MGRILKKKNTFKTKKKKRKDSAEENESVVNNNGIEKVQGTSNVKSYRDPAGGKNKERRFQQPQFIQTSVQFLREVRVELKKVAWPNRKQTMGTTIVVIGLVLFFSMYLGIVDIILSNIFRLIY